jgi:hypothetical protein
MIVREQKSSDGMRGDGWRHAVRQRERERYTLVKNLMLLSKLKNDWPHNSFILQTLISSSCMFSRQTIKHPLLLLTLPRSVEICSPTSPGCSIAELANIPCHCSASCSHARARGANFNYTFQIWAIFSQPCSAYRPLKFCTHCRVGFVNERNFRRDFDPTNRTIPLS